jgi:hypothetical protein
MHRFGFALVCLCALDVESRAASPDPADLAAPAEIQVRSRALVRQLGSEDYPEREAAQEQLAALGRRARPALLVGVNTDPNPEVRRRCAELLPTATALDIRAKLDTFLADTNGEYEHDLPGWKTFRTVVGSEWSVFGWPVWADRELDRAAREVFAELVAVHANRQLLLAIDGSRVVLADLVVGRRQELYNRRYPRGEQGISRDPTLEEMTLLVFADSRVGSQYFPRRGSVSTLMTGSGFAAAARGTDARGKVYRALARAWLDSRNEPREMSQAMTLAAHLDLPEQACNLAVRLLTMPGVTSYARGRAASTLVDYGTRKHIALLEPATTSTMVVLSVPAPAISPTDPLTREIQLRDLALAVSIQLSEQKLSDYGFSDRYANTPGYETQLFAYNRYYFRDDDARKQAFEKWAEWRKTHDGD